MRISPQVKIGSASVSQITESAFAVLFVEIRIYGLVGIVNALVAEDI